MSKRKKARRCATSLHNKVADFGDLMELLYLAAMGTDAHSGEGLARGAKRVTAAWEKIEADVREALRELARRRHDEEAG